MVTTTDIKTAGDTKTQRKLSRAEIGQFLKDPTAIKAFEEMQKQAMDGSAIYTSTTTAAISTDGTDITSSSVTSVQKIENRNSNITEFLLNADVTATTDGYKQISISIPSIYTPKVPKMVYCNTNARYAIFDTYTNKINVELHCRANTKEYLNLTIKTIY